MSKSWIRMAVISMLMLAVMGCGRPGNGDAGAWTTVATLRSDDAPWQGMDGILISAPFEANGEVRFVMDMPDAGGMDGVIVVTIPADQATDGPTLLQAIGAGQTVIIVGAAPTQVVAGVEGPRVVVNSVPAAKAWSLEIQTRPRP